MLAPLLLLALGSRPAPPPTPTASPSAAPAASQAPTRPTVPVHPLSVLDGCPDDAVAYTIAAIDSAIQVGAPLYNGGDHAGCYHVYLGTAVDLLQQLPACPGVRNALLTGTAHAATLSSYTDQAWAMRDTFDGLIDVVERKKAAKP